MPTNKTTVVLDALVDELRAADQHARGTATEAVLDDLLTTTRRLPDAPAE